MSSLYHRNAALSMGFLMFFLCLSIFSKAQLSNPVFRTTPASCHEICDGSVTFDLDRSNPAVEYYWKSTSDNQYKPLSANFLLGLCPGQYRVRRMTSNQDSLVKKAVTSESHGYEKMDAFVLNTLGKREVSLQVSFDRLMNNLNFYVQARYSYDHGKTWKENGQLHQIPGGEMEGNNYVIELPRSYDNQEEVIIEFFKRNSEVEGHVELKITQAHFHSKTYEEYSFQIDEKETIHVESTISNETDGGDGYIALRVNKGTPPYTYTWNDVKGQQRKEDLIAGTYESRVTDSKGCSVTSHFLIEPPEGTQKNIIFQLVRIEGDNNFRLSIANLYRQRMELKVTDKEGKQVKEFRINPLYEDLDMDLQLHGLPSGSYIATLSTEAFSKNLALSIK